VGGDGGWGGGGGQLRQVAGVNRTAAGSGARAPARPPARTAGHIRRRRSGAVLPGPVELLR
jgi:hypothetical protein